MADLALGLRPDPLKIGLSGTLCKDYNRLQSIGII
jgi:hypothetical protein